MPTRRSRPTLAPHAADAVIYPFVVAAIAICALLVLLILSALGNFRLFGAFSPDASPFINFLFADGIYVLLCIVAIFATYIGYRLLRSTGATRASVIPPEDSDLLIPLIEAGNVEAIDLYVKLSSLAKFTGSFTQLGLTGLPLATIGLTLLFACLTLVQPEQFLDLTKLTLGAFIGSFVQRQVERRAAEQPKTSEAPTNELDELRPPA